MTILHLTDFHFSKSGQKSIQKQSAVCRALLDTVKNIDFELIFFSGDLVDSGESKKWFSDAYELLIQPILTYKGLSSQNVFFCQGNHDINRKEIRKPFIKYMDEELHSSSMIDDFANENNKDFLDTLMPSGNYFEFLNSIDYPPDDIITQMYSVHKRRIENLKLGIVTINSSWRSTGDDENKLIFPIKYVYEALNKLSNVDQKILLHHHPLNFFKTDNQYELEDIIHNKFDVTFFGHIHKGLTSIDYTPKTGLIKILSPASLKNHLDGDMGFSLVNFDFDESFFKVDTYLYNTKQEFYYKAPNDNIYAIPASEEVKKQNLFRGKLRKLVIKEKDSANELFVSFGDNNLTFEDLFIEPLLRSQEYHTGRTVSAKPFSIKHIIESEDDYIITGDDKCGKTSLLKYIHIQLLNDFESFKSVPFYIDLDIEKKDLEKSVFERRVKNYYEINLSTTNEILENRNLILLLDNFNLSTTWHSNFARRLKKAYKNCKLVLTAVDHSELIVKPLKFENNSPILLKFENLRKKQVRALTTKWTPTDIHQREEIVTKINSLFKQLYIPFSFWTVSLFLWVVKKSGEKSIQNNVGLVNLYIESLLEREHLIKTNANFAYEKYLKLLANLSYFLLIEHKENTYSAEELEILNFIGSYLSKNPRNRNINPNSVWSYLKERGIFKQIENERYSFRLNGVFEYFLAYYMKITPKFRDEVLSDELFYLSFKNEFEIYAGFSRDDENFLDQIFAKTKLTLKDLNGKYDGLTMDNLLKSRARILPNYERKLNELSKKAKSLTFEEQDRIDLLASELDIDSDTIEGVREKKPLPLNPDDIGIIEDTLFILGRVFRNVDEIDSSKKVHEIFNYYIKSICQWGLKVIDTSKALDFQTNYESEDNIDLLYQLMSTAVPVIVQMTASDHINQKNLESIILERIAWLTAEQKGHENQFELFILYFLLIDMDLKLNRNYIQESLEYIKMPVLKNALLLKLNNYLAFKTNEDSSIQLYLRKIIQKERLKLNDKINPGDVQKELSDRKKQSLLE